MEFAITLDIECNRIVIGLRNTDGVNGAEFYKGNESCFAEFVAAVKARTPAKAAMRPALLKIEIFFFIFCRSFINCNAL